MINVRQLLAGLTQVIRSPDFPNAAALVAELDLDVSGSRITETKSKIMCIHGARLDSGAIELNVVRGIAPRREIWLIFENFSIPYRDLKDEVFGANQRIVPSKFSAGFGVAFEIDGWTCGYTASSLDGEVDAFFCEERKQVSATRASAELLSTMTSGEADTTSSSSS